MKEGRAVFVSACRPCYLFETKIAGPAMKSVVPKYRGNLEKLKSYIRNPAAVDPAYPPMPHLGLSEDEVDSVSRYLLGGIGEKPAPKAKASSAAAALEKGKAVFDSICAGCHRFDKRVVGPPFNEVVPKYKGNVEALKGFIRNPVKRNPGYPSMPKLGLKEEDIDAVARYLVSRAEKGG
jgi:cytochrome c551/c552